MSKCANLHPKKKKEELNSTCISCIDDMNCWSRENQLEQWVEYIQVHEDSVFADLPIHRRVIKPNSRFRPNNPTVFHGVDMFGHLSWQDKWEHGYIWHQCGGWYWRMRWLEEMGSVLVNSPENYVARKVKIELQIYLIEWKCLGRRW